MPSRCYADLHIHSTSSDGTFTASQVVEHASEIGLKAISLTDHDTVGGVAEAINTGNRFGLTVIPGIEMGSDAGGKDIHMLGYFIEYHDDNLLSILEDLKVQRLSRADEMCSKLSEANMPVSVEEALALAPGGVLTRAHIARAVVKKGYLDSVNSVFERYLGNGLSCFVPKYNLTIDKVIATIKDAGGLPILAHPKLSKIDDMIGSLVDKGLRGIEVYCLDHNKADIKRYLKIADDYDLLVTGGSDCHGPRTPGRFFMGECGVTEDRVAALIAAANHA
ncbi:MAG: PHP domain-containing protein [Actinomycetota bacterium]